MHRRRSNELRGMKLKQLERAEKLKSSGTQQSKMTISCKRKERKARPKAKIESANLVVDSKEDQPSIKEETQINYGCRLTKPQLSPDLIT